MQSLTKERLLTLSVALTVLLVTLLLLGYNLDCYTVYWCTVLFESYGLVNHLLYIAWAPIMLVSLGIVWWLDDRVFLAWRAVTIPWLLVSTIVAVFIPDVGAGFISVPVKLYAVLGLSILYGLISVLIILVQSIRVYWLKK